jgi:hypothetical protein
MQANRNSVNEALNDNGTHLTLVEADETGQTRDFAALLEHCTQQRPG